MSQKQDQKQNAPGAKKKITKEQRDKKILNRQIRRMDISSGQQATNKLLAVKAMLPEGQQFSFQEINDKTNAAAQQFLELVTKQVGKANNQTLLSYVGAKTAMAINKNFASLSVEQKRRLLIEIFADDLPPQVMNYLMQAAPHVLNYGWSVLQNTRPVKYLMDKLKQYTGIDLNDDVGYNNNRFTYDASFSKNIDWSSIDPQISSDVARFDGVNVQSILSILAPEYASCRIPSDSSTKTGLYSRVFSTTVTTNAAGNAIVVIFPDLIATSSGFTGFVNTYNDSTLNINTGVQTPACTSQAGPMFGLVGFNQLRVSGLAVQIQSIVSTLNNQGRVVTVMNNSSSPGTSTAAICSLDNARDREYNIYTSMSNINGHRLVYMNNTNIPGEFGTTSSDFIGIIISGAVASQQVLQLNIHYNVEYTISPGSIATVEAPPLGPFTVQCLSTSLARRPELRVIGSQELKELYCQLLSCSNVYQSVFECLTKYQFGHKHDELNFNPGAQIVAAAQAPQGIGQVTATYR